MIQTPENDRPNSLEDTIDTIKHMRIPYGILQHSLNEIQTILQFGGLAAILQHPKDASSIIESIGRTDEEMERTDGETTVQSWDSEDAPSIAETIAAQRKQLGSRAAECVSYAYRDAAVAAFMTAHPETATHLYPKALDAINKVEGIDGNDVIELTQRSAKAKKTTPQYELVLYYLGQVLDELNVDEELKKALMKE